MISGIVPKEGRFFDLFKELSGFIVEAAVEFRDMTMKPGDIDRHVRHIKELEHRGDGITHRTMELLHKTFITPLDREDIHKLISRLDDVLDFIDAAGQRTMLYELKSFPTDIQDLAQICVQSCNLMKDAVAGLDNLKNPEGIIKLCVEINRLENDADHIHRSGIARLFREETDIKQLLKLKEIYELLETVTDRCEDVANIIDGIVLEYA